MGELKVECTRQPKGAVLSLAGEVSYEDGPRLEAEVSRLVEGKPSVVAVDLSGLTFISSVGMAALVALHREVHSYGGVARLVGPSANVFDVLDRSRIVELMPVFPSVERAMQTG